MEITFDDLIKAIATKRRQVSTERSLLVAVSGIDGSGKGYITEKIVNQLNEQAIKTISINLDAWHALPEKRFNCANPGEHFYHYAFNFDRLFQTLIYPLQNNRAIDLKILLTGIAGIPFWQTYQFENVDVIVLEGIFLLKRELRQNYDLAFWIECSFETALARALQRNQEGLPPEEIVRDYQTIYFPAQKVHLAVDDPKSATDGIYINEPKFSTRI